MSEATNSQDEANTSKAPGLIRFNYRVARWTNTSPQTGQYLVPAQHLTAINQAIDRYITFIKQHSLPSVRATERYALASENTQWLELPTSLLANVPFHSIPQTNGFVWFLGVDDHPFCDLINALLELEENWPAIVKQSEDELGTTVEHLPQEANLRNLFLSLLSQSLQKIH